MYIYTYIYIYSLSLSLYSLYVIMIIQGHYGAFHFNNSNTLIYPQLLRIICIEKKDQLHVEARWAWLYQFCCRLPWCFFCPSFLRPIRK